MLLVCWNTRESFITRGKKFTMFRLMILVNQTCISCWEWARWLDKLINNVYIWSMLGFMAVILSQGATEKGRPGDFFGGRWETQRILKPRYIIKPPSSFIWNLLSTMLRLKMFPPSKRSTSSFFSLKKTRFFLHAELGHFWRWCTTGKLFCSW